MKKRSFWFDNWGVVWCPAHYFGGGHRSLSDNLSAAASTLRSLRATGREIGDRFLFCLLRMLNLIKVWQTERGVLFFFCMWRKQKTVGTVMRPINADHIFGGKNIAWWWRSWRGSAVFRLSFCICHLNLLDLTTYHDFSSFVCFLNKSFTTSRSEPGENCWLLVVVFFFSVLFFMHSFFSLNGRLLHGFQRVAVLEMCSAFVVVSFVLLTIAYTFTLDCFLYMGSVIDRAVCGVHA